MTFWQIAIRLLMNFAVSPTGQNAMKAAGRAVLRQASRSFIKAVNRGTKSRERERVK